MTNNSHRNHDHNQDNTDDLLSTLPSSATIMNLDDDTYATATHQYNTNTNNQQHSSSSTSSSYSLSEKQFQKLLKAVNPLQTPQAVSGLGNPGPLGLASFALTTFVLSVFNAGLLDKALEPVVLPLALFYGGIAQFAAGMWEFQTNNTFGATAFTSYGSFWMSFAGYVYLIVPKLAPEEAHSATGIYLLAWTIFTFYMTAASFRVSRAVSAIFVLLSITFLLLTIGAFASSSVATNAGGWFGLFTAAAAWYGSAAVVINSTWGRDVLPVGAYVPVRVVDLERDY